MASRDSSEVAAPSDVVVQPADVVPPPADAGEDRPLPVAQDATQMRAFCEDGALYAHERRLIDLFVTEAGIIVVREDAVVLVGRDGQTTKTIASPRPITSADFDGRTLAIADAAMLTAYSAGLEVRHQVALTYSCATSALVEAGIYVCSSETSHGIVFTTFDTNTGRPIGRSSREFAHSGEISKRVPGTNDLVTLFQGFELFEVAPDGQDVVFVDVASLGAAGAVGNQVFAFSTPESTDLVNWAGNLFRIRGDGCAPVQPGFVGRRCFTPNGTLGTLPKADARYIALTNAESGALVGVVSESPELARAPFLMPACEAGCVLQKIDFAKRMVSSQRRLSIEPKRALAMRWDPVCRKAVLAYEVAGDRPPSSYDWTGFRIDLLGFDPVQETRDAGQDVADRPRDAGASEDAQPDTRASTGCAPVGLLDVSNSPLVNVFPVADGLIVVRNDGLTLIGRDRAVKKTVPAAYLISSAAFDGETIAVGDASAIYFFTAALEPQGMTRIVDPCWDSVVTPGGILVCETGPNRPLAFTTVDLRGRKVLKQTAGAFGNGGQPMEAAAGTPYFALSSNTFALYVVDPDGGVRAAGGSREAAGASSVFQFVGSPPSHLVTAYGALFRMFGPGCDGSSPGQPGTCLQQDSVLGTLWPPERFLALDSDGTGNLFGFVSSGVETNLCTRGCAVQKLDVVRRLVTAQQVHRAAADEIQFLRHDPFCRMVAVGYKARPLPATPNMLSHRVDLLDYLSAP